MMVKVQYKLKKFKSSYIVLVDNVYKFISKMGGYESFEYLKCDGKWYITNFQMLDEKNSELHYKHMVRKINYMAETNWYNNGTGNDFHINPLTRR